MLRCSAAPRYILAFTVLPTVQEIAAKGGLSAAYQGNPGAYSESAVLAAFPTGHPVPCEQFEDVFQALSQYLVDRAVLPIENSLGGSIHAVYDLLIQ
jgi:arogenate/prephenate dehydratase